MKAKQMDAGSAASIPDCGKLGTGTARDEVTARIYGAPLDL